MNRHVFVGLFVVSVQMMYDSVMAKICTAVLRVGDELNGPKYRTLWHTAVYRHRTRRCPIHIKILSPLGGIRLKPRQRRIADTKPLPEYCQQRAVVYGVKRRTEV